MTLPSERSRAVIQTEIFLREISKNSDVSAAIRLEAKALLRHYPEARLINGLAHLEETLEKIVDEDISTDKKIGDLVFMHIKTFSSHDGA